MLRLVEDPVREVGAQDGDVLDQRADAEGVHRVADVDGDRDALLDVQRRVVAAVEAAVLDVVVDEEGVVQQLDRHRRRQGLLDRATEGTAGGDAQRRTQPLARVRQLARDQVVQVASWLAGRKLPEQGSIGEVAVLGELPLDARRRSVATGHATRSTKRTLPARHAGSLPSPQRGPRRRAPPAPTRPPTPRDCRIVRANAAKARSSSPDGAPGRTSGARAVRTCSRPS